MKHRFIVRAGAFLFVLPLVSAGRWIAATGTGLSDLPSLFTAASYGLVAAGIAVFTVDLVLVHSLLQRKILCIRILAVFLIVLAVADRILVFSRLAAGIALSVYAATVVLLLTFDALHSRGPDFRINAGNRPSRRTLRNRPLKTIAETLLRLFPCPEPVGLYRIGSPGNNSPVLVTGNYELTVRRVVRRLRSPVDPFDCWLLVCDSRGVNVWCGSMAGHFNTDSVVQAAELTNLAGKVSGRQLILPQLCASSVSLEALESRTGFNARFGPLYIGELGEYWKNPADPAVRTARFPLTARLEMALGCPLLLTILLVLVYNFIGPGHLLVLLPALYLCSLIHGVVFPGRLLKRIGAWAVLYGAAWFLVMGLLSRALFPEHLLLYALTVGLGAAYLVTEFSGWSPLIKYSLIPHRKPHVAVDRGACIGCKRCVEVCPRAVFQMTGKRSVVVGENRCVICRSCFSQCPTGAVHHSHAPR